MIFCKLKNYPQLESALQIQPQLAPPSVTPGGHSVNGHDAGHVACVGRPVPMLPSQT